MAAKRIFYVTSSDLTAVYCDKGQVNLLGKFGLTDEGAKAFAEMLAQDPDHPSAFIVDIIEEEFRIETIPHVRGADSLRLQNRKAATIFRATTFTNTQITGRERTGRRDDQVLFSSLNKPEILQPWLDEIETAKVPLVGVYSIAILTGMLVNKLKIKHANTLVLSIQNGRLLRQSFFSNGKLKLSRLTPLSSQNHKGVLDDVLGEVNRNKRYLERLQLINFKEPLEVYTLTAGEQLQTLQSGCHNEAQINYHFLDINEIAAKLGLKQALSANEGEWCFAYLLNRRPPTGNYVAADKRAYYSQFLLRKTMVAASIVLAIAATLWGGMDIHAGQDLAIKTAQTEVAIHQATSHLAKANTEKLNSTYHPRTMRAVVEADRLLAQYKPDSLRTLSYIGESLAKHSNIELDRITWGHTQTTANPEMAAPEPGQDMGMEAAMTEPESEIETIAETAVIMGHLKVFPGNYQAAFQQIEALLKTLQNNSNIAYAQALKMPLNTDPESSLVGESRLGAKILPASFELEIGIKERAYGI